LKILFIGDIVGNPGRKAVKQVISALRKEYGIDYCIANGENSAGGSGITYVVAQELYKTGIDGITMGNHTWSKKEVTNFIDCDDKIVRPANYPSELPGKSSTIINGQAGKIGIVNVLGSVYMDSIDCPFRAAEREVEILKKSGVKVILVDIHAEATSEKCALAWYLDGRVSCVFGTHTHVQTADERVLSGGTGYITDLGMTGPIDSILGMDIQSSMDRLLGAPQIRYKSAAGPCQIQGALFDIDDKSGKCRSVERVVLS
jgi:metallophosphoesterase (TIGR00282 family)